MMNSTQNQKGSAILVVVVVLVLTVAAGLLVWNKNKMVVPAADLLPPVEERVNPEPQAESTIEVGDVSPGTSVIISNVKLVTAGYVAIKDDADGVLGRSALLEAGEHANVSITVSKNLVDGNVIYVVLQDNARVDVKDSNGNRIEVQKNVGMVMSHYENEY